MKTLKQTGVLFLLIFGLMLHEAVASDVPTSPSDAYINPGTGVLYVQKPGDISKPVPIRGVCWSPATRAPATGPSPLNPSQTVDYGFFFDTIGRNPEGHDVFFYWLQNEFQSHYLTDIPLLKQLNVNTVRTFGSFGSDPAVFNNILDELYRNDIMVIMTVAGGAEDLSNFFYVFQDQASQVNHYVPSGWMGDSGNLTFNDNIITNQKSGLTCIKMTYTGSAWTGIYWQNPANNWGSVPNAGIDLTGATKLTFWARGQNGGEVIKVHMGGLGGAYPDSASTEEQVITLTTSWRQYSIDLTGKNLSYIIGGFCVVLDKPDTIYLDEIKYEGDHIVACPEEKHFEEIVRLYKDHPAILMWAIGNEWNYNMVYQYADLTSAATAVNQAAARIKQMDTHHPVSSNIGDRPSDLATILNNCPSVDVWGLNIYMGSSFGDLFTRWQTLTTKPFYMGEFGTDSFCTTDYTIVNTPQAIQADNISGHEDQSMQATFVSGLWNEIKANMVAGTNHKPCLGGFIYTLSDPLWKVGSYNANLGGLVDYLNPPENHSYDSYNPEGFYMLGAHPDNVANEEYFGIVDADRTPKTAYNQIKTLWSAAISSATYKKSALDKYTVTIKGSGFGYSQGTSTVDFAPGDKVVSTNETLSGSQTLYYKTLTIAQDKTLTVSGAIAIGYDSLALNGSMVVPGNLTVYKAGLMLDGLQIGGTVPPVPKNGTLYVLGSATFGAPLPAPDITITSWNDSEIICTIPQKPDLETVTITKNTVKSNGVIVTPEMPSVMITSSATQGGTISPLSTVLVDPGTDQNFNIVPTSGNHIEDVIIDGHSVGMKDSYKFLNVTEPHTIRAKFDADTKPPVIKLVHPKRVESGKHIIIRGTNFGREDEVSKVLLSGNPLNHSGIWADTLIVRKLPLFSAGTYQLVVQTKEGKSGEFPVEIFERPAIDHSGPQTIKPGKVLVLNGKGFGKKDAKSHLRIAALGGNFSKEIQTIAVWTDSKIVCTIPPLPRKGNYRLSVTTKEGIDSRDYTYRQ